MSDVDQASLTSSQGPKIKNCYIAQSGPSLDIHQPTFRQIIYKRFNVSSFATLKKRLSCVDDSRSTVWNG